MTRDVFKVISHSGRAATKRRGGGGQFSANSKNLEGTWIYSALAMLWIKNDTLAHFWKKKIMLGKSLHASGEKADRIRVIGSDFIVWFSTALICKLRGFFFIFKWISKCILKYSVHIYFNPVKLTIQVMLSCQKYSGTISVVKGFMGDATDKYVTYKNRGIHSLDWETFSWDRCPPFEYLGPFKFNNSGSIIY